MICFANMKYWKCQQDNYLNADCRHYASILSDLRERELKYVGR